MSNSLWVEKYRPDTLEGYVGDEHTVWTKISAQHPIGRIFILYTPWGGRIRFAFTR
jgi:hypothetical protein